MHCFNNGCPRAAECLRHLAAENIPDEVRYVNIVNPRNIPEGENYPHFVPITKIRIAWGVKELFDHILHKEAVTMRKEIIAHFSKTHYYRMQRKEYSIKPDEQEYQRSVFRKHHVEEEPAFGNLFSQRIYHLRSILRPYGKALVMPLQHHPRTGKRNDCSHSHHIRTVDAQKTTGR